MSTDILKNFTEGTNYNYQNRNKSKKSHLGDNQKTAIDLARSMQYFTKDDAIALSSYLFGNEEYFKDSKIDYSNVNDVDKYYEQVRENAIDKQVNIGMTR